MLINIFQTLIEIYIFLKEYINLLITPNSNFLTITGTLSITIIAIAIPLSVDVISRLANRYNTNIITRLFNEEKINKEIKVLSFSIVILVLLAIFFNPDSFIGNVYYFLYISIFILDILLIVKLYIYYKRLAKYFIDTEYIYNKLIDYGYEVMKGKKNNKPSWYEINEGIGDILIYTSEINRNIIIEDYFEKYTKLINEVFELIKTDYDKFIRLVANKDFLEEWEEDQERAAMRLNFNPEDQFINLKIIINQFSRFHEKTKFNNIEISNISIQHLFIILDNISSKKNSSIIVEIILSRIIKLLNENINKNNQTNYMLSKNWYFKYLRKPENKLYYLDI